MIYRNDFETMYSEGSCNLSANGFLKYFKKMMLNTMTDEDESFLKNIIADGYAMFNVIGNLHENRELLTENMA